MAKTRRHGQGSIWVERRAHGRKVYIGQVRVGKRQHQRTLGDVRKAGSGEGLTRGMAEACLREVRASIEAEVRATTLNPHDEATTTLSRVGAAYLEHLRTFYDRKAATIQDYRIMLRKHLVPFFRNAPVATITKRRVESYAVEKRDTLSVSTISGHLIFLHGVMKYAVEEGLASRNPVAEARRPPQPHADKDIRFLTVEEVEALIRAVPDDYFGPTDRALYRTAALTGLRQGELIALRWMDVDWQAGRIRVRQSYTRGHLGRGKSKNAQRSVPMAPEVARTLDEHFTGSAFQTDDDQVFCHPQTGYFYDASKLLKRFKKALKVAGIRPVRFHDLRHTFGTQVASRGAPIVAIKDWMGHANIETTMIYVDYSPDPHGAAWIVNGFARDNGSSNCSPTTDDPRAHADSPTALTI